MSGDHADFARQLAALAERLARVSTELAATGRGLIERRLLPPETLVEALAGIRSDFETLKTQVLAAATALSLGPTPPVTTVRELEVLLRVVIDTESRRARRLAEAGPAPVTPAASEETRAAAADEARRQAEHAARARAEEEAARERAAEEARRRAEDEARRRAEEETARRAAADAERKREAEAEARRQADEAKRRAEQETQKRAAEAEERARRMEDERRQAEEAARGQAEEVARRRADEEARHRAAEETQRAAAEEARRRAEEEESRRREAEEEAAAPAAAEAEEGDLGLETAQWWISANASWTSMKSRHMSFADAVHDVLAKHPYLFSVPIQTSADYEDGLLAYGYAVLLDFIEQRSTGFVSEALNRLPARKGASLGRRLYDYLAEPLRPGFADFIKAVMVAALPRTGLWVNGGIEDSEQATTVFTRPTVRIGDSAQKAERFGQERQRFADHQFTTAVAPLTARFFRVEVTDVKDPRAIELRLSEKGSPSDQAWVATVSTRAAPVQARRQDRQGTMVTGLGRDHTEVWIGLFNADVETDKRFDLTIGLKRRPGGATAFRKK